MNINDLVRVTNYNHMKDTTPNPNGQIGTVIAVDDDFISVRLGYSPHSIVDHWLFRPQELEVL